MKKIVWVTAVLILLAVLSIPKVQFVLGGAMVNLGYRFQDHLHSDFDEKHPKTPQELLNAVMDHNHWASTVRKVFPRSKHHPKVAILACMDARIDTSELIGDTRGYYYVVRTAGSVISPIEQDMLELAVLNGVEVVILTSHTDCAAEKAAQDETLKKQLPSLTQAVLHREAMETQFLKRPNIAKRIQEGKLLVVSAEINTHNEWMTLQD